MPPRPPTSTSFVFGSYDSMPRPADRVRFGYSSQRSPRFRVSFWGARQRSLMNRPNTFSMLSILMNWLLLADPVGVPRRNPASPFQPFSNDGTPDWNPTVEASASGLRAVIPGSKVKEPRGPSPSSGCQ